ncbi:MAG TPA: hypothetical protein VK506_05030 [Conexibacter sp.]|nr:hypothetical protein [Conexibacter sp.]
MADATKLLAMAAELGGASHWANTTTVQKDRVLEAAHDVERESTPATTHRLHYESYFFLAATRQLLRVCQTYFAETGDNDLQDALDAFRDAAPDAVTFRDWSEHLDAYFAGTGWMQDGRVDRDATLDFEVQGDRVILHFDRRTLDLVDTHAAAQNVAAAASAAWWHHFRKSPPDQP